LPGQPGTSVIDGRAAAYGGPFGGLHRLKPGDPITVTTGEGTAHFTVVDVRSDGGQGPPRLALGGARLTLVTARGLPFLPVGVLRVDADLVGKPLAASPLPVTTVPRSELPMGTQTDSLFGLVLWLEALVAIGVLGVWWWHRYGPVKTWVVAFPVGALVTYYVAGEVVRLLPNLL